MEVRGSFTINSTLTRQGIVYPLLTEVTFTCAGTPTCTGTYEYRETDGFCSQPRTHSDSFRITGLNLAQPGPIQGAMTFTNYNYSFSAPDDRNCYFNQFLGDRTREFTGSWNGASGTFTFTDGLRPTGSFTAQLSGAVLPPVFPMTVNASFEGGRANVGASFSYRPQDVGTTGSVYVFALAPENLVIGANATKSERPEDQIPEYRARTPDGKDVPLGCVLAQLTASGQLRAVSISALQAYFTGVLTSAQQAVTVVNGVPTANIGGATFYLGYGPNANAMIGGGTNRSVVTVPGAVQCKPEAPRTGWWWNPGEGGRGFSVEVRGNNIFFAAFQYDVSGRSTWHVATGPVSLDGTLFQGSLLSARGGQTLGGAYPGFPSLTNVGPITLGFNTAMEGTIVWPGGVVPIYRFNIVPNGLNAPPVPGQPQSGWWWNPAEAGRGFFLEWQDGLLNIAGYMYDDNGDPVWYLTQARTPSPQSFSASWWSFADGMTLMGPWKPNRLVTNNVAPVTIQFQSSETALMTLPNGRTTQLQRHRF